MKRVFSALKRFVTVAMVGVLALLTVACSPASRAQAAMPGDRGPNPPGQVQSYEGGMNNFSDVDTNRLDTRGAAAKAKSLKDRVERNIDEKRIDSVDQYVDNYRSGTPLGERTARFGNDIRRGAGNAADDLQDVSARGSSKAGQALENAKQNTKAAGKDLINDTKKPANKATRAADRAID